MEAINMRKEDGFLRVAAATPVVTLADCRANQKAILKLIDDADAQHIQLLVLPELALTGFSCGDIIHNRSVLTEAEDALLSIREQTADRSMVIVVGTVLPTSAGLLNAAAVLTNGEILGFIPNTNADGRFIQAAPERVVSFAGTSYPCRSDLLFTCRTAPDLRLAVTFYPNLRTVNPYAEEFVRSNATVVAVLDAQPEVVGLAHQRERTLSAAAERYAAAMIYAAAGRDESSTDAVYAGARLIYESSSPLAKSDLFSAGITATELDLGFLAVEKNAPDRKQPSLPADTIGEQPVINFSLDLKPLTLTRTFRRMPFVPQDPADRTQRCRFVFQIQAEALASRLHHTRARNLFLGLSGGLDSTIALIAAVLAFDQLGWSRERIQCVTMPGFGTSKRTLKNTRTIAKELGVSLREISITASVEQHLRDIGHDGKTPDTTFENAQARERTQILMDLANLKAVSCLDLVTCPACSRLWRTTATTCPCTL